MHRCLLYELSMAIHCADGVAYISSVWVHEDLRGNRVGTTLLLDAMKMALMHGVERVQLDDMSDQFGHSSANIYTKSGMTYLDVTNGCEMIGQAASCALRLTNLLQEKPSKLDFTAVQKRRTRAVINTCETCVYVYTHRGYVT
jgi:hypothetical protein